MLRYAGTGARDFHKNPVLVNRRKSWEFHAVVQGEIYLQEPGGHFTRSRNKMWIFPPEHSHGWISEAGIEAEVVVFHFTRVPDLLRDYVGTRGFASIDLNDKQCRILMEMGLEVINKLKHPRALDALYHDKIALELSMMILEEVPVGQLPQTEERNLNRLESACTFFELNMESSPGIVEMSAVVNCSPAHLRRLFHTVYRCSPQEKLTELRFEHCRKLLATTNFSLERIAELCGYSCSSVLSRAFSNLFGISPSKWRSSYHSPAMQDDTGRLYSMKYQHMIGVGSLPNTEYFESEE